MAGHQNGVCVDLTELRAPKGDLSMSENEEIRKRANVRWRGGEMKAEVMYLFRRIELWFLRRFSTFRIIEAEGERLAGLVVKHSEENTRLQKKAESDTALIESLNRYIDMLEGKAAMQEETLRDLKRRLKEIVAKPRFLQ